MQRGFAGDAAGIRIHFNFNSIEQTADKKIVSRLFNIYYGNWCIVANSSA